jgi:hypothetical protein
MMAQCEVCGQIEEIQGHVTLRVGCAYTARSVRVCDKHAVALAFRGEIIIPCTIERMLERIRADDAEWERDKALLGISQGSEAPTP